MSNQQPIVVQEILSSPTTITIDRRRAEQIAHMAQGQQKTVAAMVEELISREWSRIHGSLTIPSLKLFQHNAADGKVSVGIAFKPLETNSSILASPESAEEFARMLCRAAAGRGAVIQTVECDYDQEVTVTRKGNGIVVQIDQTRDDGQLYRYILGMTPALAVDYAEQIRSHTALVDVACRSTVNLADA